MDDLAWASYSTALGSGWLGWPAGGEEVALSVLPGGQAPSKPADPPTAVQGLLDTLEAYFAGDAVLPWDPDWAHAAARTELDLAIYRTVGEIPAGATMTYREVAIAVGRPGAARAVGAANARNPLAPLIPCHRLVGSDGSLRGYAGGITMKRYLLALERSDG